MADPLSLLFVQQPGRGVQIGAIRLDATVRENHEYKSTVTDHPIETGGFVTDHIYESPREVTIEGEITSSPVMFFSFLGGLSDRRIEAYDQLVALKAKRDLVTIVTGLKVFSDMVIESLSFPRDQQTGKRLQFVAQLKEARFVSSQVVGVANKAAPAVKDKVATNKDVGRQETLKATAAQETKSKSALAGIIDSIGGN